MKKQIDDGGLAFPSGDTESPVAAFSPGMTLREWFAGQALAGSGWSKWELRAGLSRELANSCYAKADAMIAEGKRGR